MAGEMAAVLALSLTPEEKMARLYRQGCPVRFTLLPFRAVGTRGGLLLAAKSDYIEVEGKRYWRDAGGAVGAAGQRRRRVSRPVGRGRRTGVSC